MGEDIKCPICGSFNIEVEDTYLYDYDGAGWTKDRLTCHCEECDTKWYRYEEYNRTKSYDGEIIEKGE